MQDIKDLRLNISFDISSYKEFICNNLLQLKSCN